MAQGKEETEISGKISLNSKFWKTFLIIVAASLTFIGPTYVVYALNSILEIDYVASIASGFVLFMIGLVLIWYLVKRKIIT